MQWAGFRSVFPWRTGSLICSIPALMLAAFLAWFRWELPPLEHYYLLAYWESSRNAERPDTTTQIEWLYKTAPGSKSEPVTSQDIDSNGLGLVRIGLSSSARERGWIQLIKLPAQTWSSSELASFLQEDFYGDRTFWEVMAEPLFFIYAIPFIVLYAVIIMRREFAAEWRRVYEEICDRAFAFDSNALWLGIKGRIRSRFNPELAGGNATLSRSESFPRVQRNRLANAKTIRDGMNDVLRSGQADQSTRLSVAPQPRLIFPGAVATGGGNPHPKPWDELQWID